MQRALIIASVTVFSFLAVGYLSGDWQLAAYAFVAVAIFSAGLMLYASRGKITFTAPAKVRGEVQPPKPIILSAQRMDESYTNAKELEAAQARLVSFVRDASAPTGALRKLVSLLHDGTYGKLPPAAEEALAQVFDRTTDLEAVLHAYSLPPAPVVAEVVQEKASEVVAPVVVEKTKEKAEAPAPTSIRSLKIKIISES